MLEMIFRMQKDEKFRKAQQLSTSWPHLAETKCAENK